MVFQNCFIIRQIIYGLQPFYNSLFQTTSTDLGILNEAAHFKNNYIMNIGETKNIY